MSAPAFEFELIARDGAARRGRVTTAHGSFETPAFMPVGTAGTVKGLMPEQVAASGAQIVTSTLGALPETTAGFARLVPYREDVRVFANAFADAAIEVLADTDTNATEARLRRQVDHIAGACSWDGRAGEWARWLAGLGAG